MNCRFTDNALGKFRCNCQNKPVVYQCNCTANATGMCIKQPPTEVQDGQIVISGKKSSETYLPWFQDESEPRGSPIGTTIRLPVCSLCPWIEQPPDITKPMSEGLEIVNCESKTCIVTGYTEDHQVWNEIGSSSSDTIRRYCNRHLIGFRRYVNGFICGIAPSWHKIRFIEDALKLHEIVMWLDADAFITNQDIKICDVFSDHDEFAIATDQTSYNCGVLIVRRTEFTLQLLKDIWDHRHENNRLWEQDTVKRMIQEGNLCGHITLMAPRKINSRYPPSGNDAFDWHAGDFIAHAYNTGTNIAAKRAHVRRLLKQI